MTRRTARFQQPADPMGPFFTFPDFYCRADLTWEPTDEQVETLKADMVRAVVRKYDEPGWTAKVRGVKITDNGNGTWTVGACVRIMQIGAES